MIKKLKKIIQDWLIKDLLKSEHEKLIEDVRKLIVNYGFNNRITSLDSSVEALEKDMLIANHILNDVYYRRVELEKVLRLKWRRDKRLKSGGRYI